MSVKSIPKRERGLLDPKAYFYASVVELEEQADWTHKDGVTAAYRGKLQIEGLVPDTSTESFDPWMKKQMFLGFYIPGEKASWYDSNLERLNNFSKACGVDIDKFDPEKCVGKTIIIQVSKAKTDGTPTKKTRPDGTVFLLEEREEIAKFYHPSTME